MDERIDTELVAHGDSRNVSNHYKTWKVSAIKADLQRRANPLHVAIENYQHDYNIGTIVRSANAFNVAGLHIIGKRHWNRRGAMATEKYLEIFHHDNIVDFKTWADQADLIVTGVDNVDNSILLGQTTLPERSVYLFGQEGPGLSAEAQAICQTVVAIEQYGSTRSINLGVAAGIILYEWLRQNHRV